MHKKGLPIFSIVIIIVMLFTIILFMNKDYSVESTEKECKKKEVTLLKSIEERIIIEPEEERSRKIRKAIESRRGNRKRRKIYNSICIF